MLSRPPCRPLEAVEEGEREIGEDAHVEIDHGDLLGAIKLGRRTDQSEARIVDHELRLALLRGQRLHNARAGIRHGQVKPEAERRPCARGRDFGSKCGEHLLTPRDQHQFVAVAGEHTGKLGTDPGGGAGDQRDRPQRAHQRASRLD